MAIITLKTNAGNFFVKKDESGFDLSENEDESTSLSEQGVDTFFSELEKPMNNWAPELMHRIVIKFLRNGVRTIHASYHP